MMFIMSYLSSTFLVMSGLWIGVGSGDLIFLTWVGLELMTWGGISFFFFTKIRRGGEVFLKFFLLQSLGAIVWFLSILPGSVLPSLIGGEALNILNLLAISLKLGIFPFVGWLVDLIVGGEFIIIMMILGPQKILPMFILGSSLYYNFSLDLIKLIVLFNLYFLCLGFLKKSGVKFFLILSSLYHTSVLMLFFSSMGGSLTGFIYFFYYLMFFLFFTHFMCSSKISPHPDKGGIPSHYKEWSFIIFFLSMSGFPPYGMFFIKLFFFNMFFSMWEDLFWLLFIPPMFLYMISFMWFVLSSVETQSPVIFSPFWRRGSKYWIEEQEYILMTLVICLFLFILLFF